jgi:hypothetical protein
MRNIDVARLSNAQLETYIGNCERYGKKEFAREAAIERIRRGRYKQRHLTFIDWTPSRVEQLLSPFTELAAKVRNSKRKAWVEAGGGRRKRRSHPEALWVDQYCGIKVGGINATISCHIKHPGDDPVLTMIIQLNRKHHEMTYQPHEVDIALQDWTDVFDDIAAHNNTMTLI